MLQLSIVFPEKLGRILKRLPERFKEFIKNQDAVGIADESEANKDEDEEEEDEDEDEEDEDEDEDEEDGRGRVGKGNKRREDLIYYLLGTVEEVLAAKRTSTFS